MPGVAGEYRYRTTTGLEWFAGRPVFGNGRRRLWRGLNEWAVNTDIDPNWDMPILLNGCVNWCPALQNPNVDKNDQRKRRYENCESIGSYIRIICYTHKAEAILYNWGRLNSKGMDIKKKQLKLDLT